MERTGGQRVEDDGAASRMDAEGREPVRGRNPPPRHPMERPLWLVAVVANAIAVVVVIGGLAGLDRLPESVTDGPWDELLATVLVAVLVWPAWAAVRSRLEEAWALGSSLPVAPDAAIAALAEEVAYKMGIRPPGLRLLANGPTDRYPAVVAWGHGPVLVDRLLVNALWPAHPRILAFVIAHGMAGIRLGHTRRMDAVLLGVAAEIPVLGGWLERTQTASRDRLAAWIAPDGAAALTVLATGNTRWDEAPLDELRAAATALPNTGWLRASAAFGEPEPLLGRVAALDRLGLLPDRCGGDGSMEPTVVAGAADGLAEPVRTPAPR